MNLENRESTKLLLQELYNNVIVDDVEQRMKNYCTLIGCLEALVMVYCPDSSVESLQLLLKTEIMPAFDKIAEPEGSFY